LREEQKQSENSLKNYVQAVWSEADPGPSIAPSVRPCSDDFAVQLSVYGKLLSSQPASVYHGGLWLYLLYLLHHPELPVPSPGAIDRSASPDHLFQPSW
jgi:hypothetical protein